MEERGSGWAEMEGDWHVLTSRVFDGGESGDRWMVRCSLSRAKWCQPCPASLEARPPAPLIGKALSPITASHASASPLPTDTCQHRCCVAVPCRVVPAGTSRRSRRRASRTCSGRSTAAVARCGCTTTRHTCTRRPTSRAASRCGASCSTITHNVHHNTARNGRNGATATGASALLSHLHPDDYR